MKDEEDPPLPRPPREGRAAICGGRPPTRGAKASSLTAYRSEPITFHSHDSF